MMISIAGREIEEDDEQAEALLMSAHEKKIRPLCLCRKPNPQLQIAHIGEHYFVKRLPRDAGAHALHMRALRAPVIALGQGRFGGQVDHRRPEK